MSKQKIIFFGTSEFAVPVLSGLVRAGYEIAAVVTRPDKPAGREKIALPSPIKVLSQKLNIPLRQPSKISIDTSFPIVNVAAIDLFVVASYGEIIPSEILAVPKFGALNIHPSLLPKYRGPSPIHAAILNGDSETGITIIKLDEMMDHGPVVASEKYLIMPHKLYYRELHDELAEIGTRLLIKTLPDYFSGKRKAKAQDHARATFTKMIEKKDGRIDWNFAVEKIWSMVRAYQVWPVAWTMLDGKRLKIYRATPLTSLPNQERGVQPGSIIIYQNKLLIQTSSVLLELLELQLEGAIKMTADQFLRGQHGLQNKKLI